MDKQISALAVPAVLNLMIVPLVGIVDMMWVGRMNDALAIAGMQVVHPTFTQWRKACAH